jgi:hypothetical protein
MSVEVYIDAKLFEERRGIDLTGEGSEDFGGS